MIRRILVANRGEIARRIFRTCELLRIQTVAVYSDADSGEPHAREADAAVHLPGNAAAETYLNQKAIIDAAVASGADAIHPGYGFLSENAEFAKAVSAAGLTWIGPPPEAIASMGSKIEAKAIMESAGVPTLPGANLAGLDDDEIIEAAEHVGLPILVKASAGGGGKGMRTVAERADIVEAVHSARREAAGAFGDDTVFLERFLTGPRHIEIQVFGDDHGSVVSLNERECSIQRRHQKIIEECPSPVITPGVRDRMGQAAVAAARAVGYVGAGTVEFLYQDGEFFFLEMNTRLQVEHPVTEMTTGLDLVKLQILVAGGEPLPGDAMSPPIEGHAIEARLYAEDPANGFLPVTGGVHEFSFEQAPGLRVDSGVEAGSSVTVHYDPMLAKVIVHGHDRLAAAAGLAAALRGARIHSSTTNRDLLVNILEHERFLAGEATTEFIDSVGLDELARPLLPEALIPSYAAAAALSDRAVRLASSPNPTIPAGFRNVGLDRQAVAFSHEGSELSVVYETDKGGLRLVEPPDVTVGEVSAGSVELIAGESMRLEVSRYGKERFVDGPAGSVRLTLLPRFPSAGRTETAGSLHAPMPGRIVRVEVSEGDAVSDGQPLIVLEAMKMEHTLRAPHEGTVMSVNCRVGDQVEGNDVLIVVE